MFVYEESSNFAQTFLIMAEKIEIFKGIRQMFYVTGLTPNTAYYMMLVHRDSGEFICTDPVTSDVSGMATFVFPYTVTNNLEEGKVTLQLFDVARNIMVAYVKNAGKVIETYLKDDPDVDDYQAEEKEIPNNESTNEETE